jgi:Leucine-rich repeat (LRR) protein
VSPRLPAKVAAALAGQPWQRTGHLSLRGLGLKSLPDLGDEVSTLRSLDLSSNRLSELPDWLWNLERLERLDLASNRLTHLGAGVGRLVHLVELNLSENRLTALPPALAGCAQLRRLDLFGNALTDIAPLAAQPGLVSLDASSNRLSAIAHLPSPATLVTLDLSSNSIASLPLSLGQFAALRRLNLSGNRLTSGVMPILMQLPLTELYVDGNQMASPPVEIAGDPTLLRFSALGNPFGELPAAGRRAIGEEALDVVPRHISGYADPARRYYDAPTYSFDFSLAVDGVADASKVVDLYYKRFRGVPATVELGDGKNVRLADLSRRTALDIVEGRLAPRNQMRVHLEQTKDPDALEGGTAFVAESIARLGHSTLVPKSAGASSIPFDQEELVPDWTASEVHVAGTATGTAMTEYYESIRYESPSSRVLNVALSDEQGRVLESEGLEPLRTYLVRVDIGPEDEASVIVNPIPIPVERLTPSSTEGWWFGVVVTSSDIDVDSSVHRLFLPFAGRSWVCGCAGPEHVCKEYARRPYLLVPLRTREHAGKGMLRATIYDRNNAVQSVLVEFDVGDAGEGRGEIRGVCDFSLADDLALAERLQPRSLNILTNASTNGTHNIVVNDGDRVIPVDLKESEADAAVKNLRAKLTAITLGSDAQRSQYDTDNQKPTKAFTADLRGLALLGSMLWNAVVPHRDDRAYLRERLAARSKIQIARITNIVFPWALVYDIPRELAATWTLCPLLEHWDGNRDLLASYPTGCPYQQDHHANVLCPYGFWGFKHLIEQPPSTRQGVPRTTIRVTSPGRAAMSRSLALNQALTSAHFEDLGAALGDRFDVERCDTRDAIRRAFADPRLPLVYFYCHGKTALLADTNMTVPFLEIGLDDRIGPTDFAAWDEDGNWGPEHWKEIAPLVFINGCETAMLSPEDLVSFVEGLAGVDAAGVVGTEIPVTQRVAGEVALGFYRQFAGAGNETVGMALYRTRIDLLRKGNLSGLVYTPFCSMDLALEPAI